jgi:hypothetical protein
VKCQDFCFMLTLEPHRSCMRRTKFLNGRGDNAGHSMGNEMCASVCHEVQGRVCLWPSLSLIISRRRDRHGKHCLPGIGNFVVQRVALPLFLHL